MTDEFRLVLCEPAVLARVKKAAAKKVARLKRWQGPLEACVRPEWDAWYQAKRGTIITVVQPRRRRATVSKAA